MFRSESGVVCCDGLFFREHDGIDNVLGEQGSIYCNALKRFLVASQSGATQVTGAAHFTDSSATLKGVYALVAVANGLDALLAGWEGAFAPVATLHFRETARLANGGASPECETGEAVIAGVVCAARVREGTAAVIINDCGRAWG